MKRTTVKQRVELSSYCWIITLLTTAFICGIFICCLKIADNDIAVWLWGVAVAVLFLSALCYMPLSISLDNESLNINRSVKIKSIPLTEIANVKLCAPMRGYVDRIRAKYTAKWGVQMPGMNFQTRSKLPGSFWLSRLPGSFTGPVLPDSPGLPQWLPYWPANAYPLNTRPYKSCTAPPRPEN